MNPALQTRSGVLFEVGNLRPEQVRISDITYRLARIVRFGGDAGSYTVAHHSMAAMALAKHLGYHDRAQAACLIHDLHEAYTGDIPSPMKPVLGEPWFRLERQAFDAVMEALGTWELFTDHLDVVKRVDQLLLHAEARALYPNPPIWVLSSMAAQVPRECLGRRSGEWGDGAWLPVQYQLENLLLELHHLTGAHAS